MTWLLSAKRGAIYHKLVSSIFIAIATDEVGILSPSTKLVIKPFITFQP